MKRDMKMPDLIAISLMEKIRMFILAIVCTRNIPPFV